MKFYIKALTEKGTAALQQHLDDTANLDNLEKIKGKAIVKHKVFSEEPLIIMMKPRKAVMYAARITPGLHQFKLDYIAAMNKEMLLNGATPTDFTIWVEGKK